MRNADGLSTSGVRRPVEVGWQQEHEVRWYATACDSVQIVGVQIHMKQNVVRLAAKFQHGTVVVSQTILWTSNRSCISCALQ